MSHLKKAIIFTAFTPEQMPRLQDILEEHRNALEDGNLFEYWERVVVTTPAAANTEFAVTCENLNRTPKYYLILKKDRAVDIYDGGTKAERNKIYLKATVASAVITLAVIG